MHVHKLCGSTGLGERIIGNACELQRRTSLCVAQANPTVKALVVSTDGPPLPPPFCSLKQSETLPGCCHEQ